MTFLKNTYLSECIELSLNTVTDRSFNGAISTDDIVGCPLRTFHLIKNSKTRIKPRSKYLYKNMLSFYESEDIEILRANCDTIDQKTRIQGVADLMMTFNNLTYVVRFVEMDSKEAIDHPMNHDVVSCALSIDICSAHAGILVLCFKNERKIHYVDPDEKSLEEVLGRSSRRCSSIFKCLDDNTLPSPLASPECELCEFKSICPAKK